MFLLPLFGQIWEKPEPIITRDGRKMKGLFSSSSSLFCPSKKNRPRMLQAILFTWSYGHITSSMCSGGRKNSFTPSQNSSQLRPPLTCSIFFKVQALRVVHSFLSLCPKFGGAQHTVVTSIWSGLSGNPGNLGNPGAPGFSGMILIPPLYFAISFMSSSYIMFFILLFPPL